MNILSNLVQPMAASCANTVFKKWCVDDNRCFNSTNNWSMRATWGQYKDKTTGRSCGSVQLCNCGCKL